MRRARTLNNELGTVKAVFVLLILACMIYVGVKLGIPYYKYSVFKSEAKEIARISSATQLTQIDRVLTQVYEKARDLNIPLEEKDIYVTKDARGVRVETGWTETVDFLGIYQYTFDFIVDVEG